MVHHGPGFAPIGFHLFGLLSLFVLAAGAGVALLIVWAVRASGRPAYPVTAPLVPAGATPLQPASRETPLDILARRFASGEITAEEYEHARDLLGGGPNT